MDDDGIGSKRNLNQTFEPFESFNKPNVVQNTLEKRATGTILGNNELRAASTHSVEVYPPKNPYDDKRP